MANTPINEIFTVQFAFFPYPQTSSHTEHAGKDYRPSSYMKILRR
jgi:hypothetical protein